MEIDMQQEQQEQQEQQKQRQQQADPLAAAVQPAFKTTISKQPFYYFNIILIASNTAAAGASLSLLLSSSSLSSSLPSSSSPSSSPMLPAIDEIQYRNHLSLALGQWAGATGAGTSIDILKFDYPAATIRVPYSDHKSVWQALTVYSFRLPGGDTDVRFQVMQSSSFAMGVAAAARGMLQ
ncbi:hypothetical protein GGI12_006047 [Dipsacomyces acuminosporus]|nr:hypothetical protein GGI12_006047 [Dipsacomyces acuminosporus]